MNSLVRAVVRLCTATGTPRLAMLRARLAPITASPVTPMRLCPVDSVIALPWGGVGSELSTISPGGEARGDGSGPRRPAG